MENSDISVRYMLSLNEMLPRGRFERLFSQIVESLNMQSLSHPELPDLVNKNTGFLAKFESQINTNSFLV